MDVGSKDAFGLLKSITKIAWERSSQAALTRTYKEILVEDIPLENNKLLRSVVGELKELTELLWKEHGWKESDVKDDETPRPEHVAQAWGELMTDLAGAGNQRKRKILLRAFVQSFRRDLFKEGLNNILRPIVRELEYPDFWALRTILADHRVLGETFEAVTRPPEWSVRISVSNRHFPYVGRLRDANLLWVLQESQAARDVVPTHLAARLLEYAWDDGDHDAVAATTATAVGDRPK